MQERERYKVVAFVPQQRIVSPNWLVFSKIGAKFVAYGADVF